MWTYKPHNYYPICFSPMLLLFIGSLFMGWYYGVLGVEEPHQAILNLVVKLYCDDNTVREALLKNSSTHASKSWNLWICALWWPCLMYSAFTSRLWQLASPRVPTKSFPTWWLLSYKLWFKFRWSQKIFQNLLLTLSIKFWSVELHFCSLTSSSFLPASRWRRKTHVTRNPHFATGTIFWSAMPSTWTSWWTCRREI
jgi:hypothetical protein